MLGIDPGPYTLADLVTMLTATRTDAWQHTAAILAMIRNVNRGKNQQALPPSAFNPMLSRKRGGNFDFDGLKAWAKQQEKANNAGK